jgi:hypothetical protein
MNRTVIIVAAIVAAVNAGVPGWYALRTPPAPPPVVAPPAPPPPPAPPATPAIANPVGEAPLAASTAPVEPVPLDHSDAAMRPALSGLFAGHALPPFLHLDRIIRNVVATVDALPRASVSPTVMPVDPVPGHMAVANDGGAPVIAADNDARYTPYVEALKAADMRLAASVYLEYYPLFQQAYQELGYPNGYFNDRLVSVIDLMLATPTIEGPIHLAQPKVVYVYADPALEALPAGQKILLRIGKANADVVKAKLREFRAQITKSPPPR